MPLPVLKAIFRVVGWLFAGFAALILLGVGYSSLYGPIKALCWHCVHGNKVVVDGHTFTLPLLWYAHLDAQYHSTEIVRGRDDFFGLMDSGSISIGKLQGYSVLDDKGAVALQQSVIDSLHQQALRHPYHPPPGIFPLDMQMMFIPARSMIFVCRYDANEIKQPKAYRFRACFASGTDWSVGLAGTPKEIVVAEQILASAQ